MSGLCFVNFPPGQRIFIYENQPSLNVYKFTASTNEKVTWKLGDCEQSQYFKINSSTGQLSFISAMDYENPLRWQQYYEVYVGCEIEGSSYHRKANLGLTVNIKDSDEIYDYINTHQVGNTYNLGSIKDYDGYLHAKAEYASSDYKYQGQFDVNADGIKEAIYTNQSSKRWVTATNENTNTGRIDYGKYGESGTTRVVGIYIDPLVTSGDVVQYSDHDSQYRFQNDLGLDNLTVKTAGDYDGDGFQEVYWKTNDGTAYLRALMHADGNIQYANYQSEEQMSNYLISNGYESVISDIV